MADISSNGWVDVGPISIFSSSRPLRRNRKHKSYDKNKYKSQTLSLQSIVDQIPESNANLTEQSQSFWNQLAETRANKTQTSRNTTCFNNEFPTLPNAHSTILKTNNACNKSHPINDVSVIYVLDSKHTYASPQQTHNTILKTNNNVPNQMHEHEHQHINKIEHNPHEQTLPTIESIQVRPVHSNLNKNMQCIPIANGLSNRYSGYKATRIDSMTILKRLSDAALLEQQKRNIALHKTALPPLQKYIEHLLYSILNEEKKEFVLKQLRKLPWNDVKIREFVTDRLHNIGNMSCEKIGCIAAIVAALNRYYGIGCYIVDEVCEQIRVGLEMEIEGDEHNCTQQQRRLIYVKFLGELYIYRVVQSQVIMDTLYLIVTYNNDNHNTIHVSEIQKKSAVEFRICLCCMLLEVCGEYLRATTLKTRCHRFLLYFQRFILVNAPIPIEIEWWVNDVLEFIAPRMRKYHMMHHGLPQILQIIDGLEGLSQHKDALSVLNKDNKDHDCEFVKEYDRMMKQYGTTGTIIEKPEKTKMNKLRGIIPIRVLSKKQKHCANDSIGLRNGKELPNSKKKICQVSLDAYDLSDHKREEDLSSHDEKKQPIYDVGNRKKKMDKLAPNTPGLQFEIKDGKVVISYQLLNKCTINFYTMNTEVLFSFAPFLQDSNGKSIFSYIAPNESINVELKQETKEENENENENTVSINIPEALQNKNIFVEVVSDTITQSAPYYHHQLIIQLTRFCNYGHLRVLNKNKPDQYIKRAYVKVYAKMNNNTTEFCKDGYTDIRGGFNYAAISTDQLDRAVKFSILIATKKYGCLVQQTNVLKQ